MGGVWYASVLDYQQPVKTWTCRYLSNLCGAFVVVRWCAHNNEYTFNSLLVLQLFPLWIGLRVGSGRVQKPHKLTGRVTAFVGPVGPGNFDPRATLVVRLPKSPYFCKWRPLLLLYLLNTVDHVLRLLDHIRHARLPVGLRHDILLWALTKRRPTYSCVANHPTRYQLRW